MLTALRRLLVVSTLLSTLMGGLGWSHPACDMTSEAVVSAPSMKHGEDGAHMAEPAAATNAGQDHQRCHDAGSERDGRAGAPAAMCVMMAHCASAVLTSLAMLESTHGPVDAPQHGRETRPLDPGHEPEPDPPRA